MVFARRAAAAYVDDLRSALKDSGLPVTAPNVRLAFLVGPFAAARVLRTRPDQPLRRVLSAEAIAANPYMSGATVAMLVRKAATDVSATAPARAGEPAALQSTRGASRQALRLCLRASRRRPRRLMCLSTSNVRSA
jgi:hypothetical protein